MEDAGRELEITAGRELDRQEAEPGPKVHVPLLITPELYLALGTGVKETG
jgi:hypothetical protein